ncbi:MAG: hypothetical protein ACYS6W_02645 [Planctomycetota bacterium]|jgi:hypothetical protein
MNKTKNNTQDQEVKTCKIAIVSPLLSILGICLLVLILYWEGAYSFFAFSLMPFYLTPFYVYGHLISGLMVIAGIVVGTLAIRKRWDKRGTLKVIRFAIVGVVIGVVFLVFWIWHSPGSPFTARKRCAANLRALGTCMLIYTTGDYPMPTDEWCDLLIEFGNRSRKKDMVAIEKCFKCPANKKGRCHYAMNPNCGPNSSPDMVLLFETEGGWNLYGGPEMLTTENHKPKGCNVLFNDLHVEFVKTERLGELKWEAEEEEERGLRNYRRPHNREEIKYLFENMVWYHRFTNEEISSATGLMEKSIVAALKRFDIRPDNRPKRAKDVPLLVLPYPGGRHPRIGFLDGAIDPQRETKFSVFTPWDANSYVVVDVPEAIWSNLGLTYLAHTHIDTIWAKQDIVLPRLEWNRRPDGTLDIERKLPNGIKFGVKVKPERQAVRMEMWLKNGTDKKLSDLRVQNCVMTKMAAGFQQQTNDNKVFTNPYVACRSSDGKRWIITAWENCNNPWANDKCPCFHSDPKFPDTKPGQTHRLRGWLSFYEGTDIEAEFERIEATGWRKK